MWGLGAVPAEVLGADHDEEKERQTGLAGAGEGDAVRDRWEQGGIVGNTHRVSRNESPARKSGRDGTRRGGASARRMLDERRSDARPAAMTSPS